MLKTKVTDSIYFFTDDSIFKDYSNSSVILTERGPVVIDTFGTPKHWKFVEEFIKEKGYHEPIIVIYTHGHLDHVLGNQVKNPKYPIYAHNKTISVMDEVKERILPKIIKDGFLTSDIELIYPTYTFDKEIKIEVGNFSFKLIHTPGHSDDSITIYEEKNKIAFVGDNFIEINNHIVIPKFNFNQGITTETNKYLSSFLKVKNLEPYLIIQGHGSTIEPKRFFDTINLYVKLVLDFSKNAVSKGKNLKEIQNTLPNEVLNRELIKNIWGLEGEYSTFKDNLVSAYNYFIEGNYY